MPGFDPNILRDEEKVGGFEPESTNDDTFFLEQLPAYPEPTPLAIDTDTSASEVAVEEQIEQTETELPPMEDEPAEQTTPVDNEPPPAPPETKEAGIPGEPLVLDNSLIDMLKDDLEKSKRKKEEQARIESENEAMDDSSDTEPEFESYAAYAQHQAEAADTPEGEDVVVDLSDIAGDHPSTYGIERNSMKNEKNEKASPSQTEKKRRVPWLFIGGGVAAVLALALVGYFYFIPHGSSSVTHHADSTAAGHANAHGKEKHADTHGKEHTDTHGKEHADTHGKADTHGQEHADAHGKVDAHGQEHTDAHGKEHTDAHGKADAYGKEHTDAHGKIDTDAHGKVDTHGKEHTDAHGKVDAHGKEKTNHAETAHGSATHKKEPTTAHVPKEKHETHKTETVVAHAAPHNTPRIKAHDKPAETKNESKPYKPQMPPPAYARGEYVIQVYASPSADDADEWLEQLRKRNITDGFITSQLVRGQTWYRVRFGKFSTREEAETKASQLGFSNIWIVRIR